MFTAPKCWHPSGCIYNSNTSVKYHKCRQEGYSMLHCKIDYMEKSKDKLEEANRVK